MHELAFFIVHPLYFKLESLSTYPRRLRPRTLDKGRGVTSQIATDHVLTCYSMLHAQNLDTMCLTAKKR